MVTAVVVLVVAGVAGAWWWRSHPAGPSAPVARAGWSGQALLCPDPDASARLAGLGRAELRRLGGDPRTVLAAAGCRRDGGRADGGGPGWEPGHTWFVVGTDADRFGVRLVGVDGRRRAPHLDVELDVLADGCATTADYRGALVLLVRAPPGARTPEVELREVPTPC